MSEMERSNEVHAYHDRELGAFARWRFERRLRRDPALRRELDALTRLGGWLREAETQAVGPDLWDGIALRLPAIDAAAAEAARPARGAWLRPAGAFAAAAVLVLAIWFGSFDAAAPSGGAVRWMDSGGRPVMVLDDAEEADVTIIWVLDDAVEGAARGGRNGVA